MRALDDAVALATAENWIARQSRLIRLAECQLFFVGGAPRSGTTWLQQLLDAHPEVSCRGEGLIPQRVAKPIDTMMVSWREAISEKNNGLFGQSGGYPEPAEGEADHLLGTAVLLALDRQRREQDCRAVGEKTPENVFLFPRLQRLFPRAKFVGIARDPRDLLASAWHMFQRTGAGEDESEAKRAFIRMAMPSIDQGARAMLDMVRAQPDACCVVTYEAMHEDASAAASHVFAFLGVSTDSAMVANCVERTSFAMMSRGGRGGRRETPFLRKGQVGDWRSTFTPEMGALIMAELGWMFPAFGWTP